VVTERSVNLWR